MKTPIKIDAGVPIPKIKRTYVSKYPWASMQIGDSFFIARSLRSMAGAINYVNKTTNKRFIARTIEGGTRVWRTK